MITPEIPLWLSAALVGLIAAFWQRVKTWLSQLFGLVVCQCYVSGATGEALALYVHSTMRRMPGGVRRYSSYMTWVRPIRRNTYVPYESIFNLTGGLYWNGGRPLWIGVSGKGRDPHTLQLACMFLRGTFNPDQLIISAMLLRDQRIHGTHKVNRFEIIRFGGHGSKANRFSKQDTGSPGSARVVADVNGESVTDGGETYSLVAMGGVRLLKYTSDELGPEIPDKAVEKLALSEEAEDFVQDVHRWLQSKDWYYHRNIPWRRGYLFCGPPGNGKTSLARAVACDEGLPVCVFDLASMDNHELFTNWEQMLTRAPCIAMMEDMDGIFEGRENKLGENGGGLSFDGLLNCIGGIQQADGIILIITSNHPEKLDPAIGVPRSDEVEASQISSRPGRVDRVVYLNNPSHDGRLKLARRILQDCPSLIPRLVAEGDNDSAAQFQERCRVAAENHYWTNRSDKQEATDGYRDQQLSGVA